MANLIKIGNTNVEQDISTDDVTTQDITKLDDDTFLNTAEISFDNNEYVNSMFINEIKNKDYSDFDLSDNVVFNSAETCIKINDLTKIGVYYSTEKCTDETYNSKLNNFFLVVDQEIPTGCNIIYYIVTGDNKRFLIKPNNDAPLELKIPCYKFKLQAYLVSNKINTPVLNGFAVLYYDEYVHNAYELMNLNFDNGDTVTLVRDKNNEDKLVKILTDKTRIELNYDDAKDKRLSSVKTYSLETETLKEESDMVYMDYTDSSNITEEVLTKVVTTKH